MAERGVTKPGMESRDTILEFANTLLAMVEEKDPYIRQHCERVANYCAHFCGKFSLLPPRDLDVLFFAGKLHDIGLMFGASELIGAGEALSADAEATLRKHPGLGEKLLSGMSLLARCLPIIRHHHEAYDGSGYPDGIRGDAIPLGARLIALFDRFDWLTSPRFPRKGLDTMAALEEIIRLAGKDFDGALVDQFAQFIESTSGVSREYMQDRKKETVNLKAVFGQILQKFASGKITPPVMPQIVQELQGIVEKPTSTTDELASAIEKEPVIALRLISIANSPAYRGMRENRTVRQAIPRLGLRETMSVVMAIAHKSLYQTANAHYRFLMDKLWAHSLATAYAAKLLAEHLRLPEADVLFLMGLTHDIGKTFLLKAFSEEAALKGMDMKLVLANIQEAHLSLSSVMLKRWGFNEGFIHAVSLHEKNEFDPAVSKECLVVNLANMLTRTIGYSLLEGTAPADIRSAQLLEIGPADLQQIGERTLAMVKELTPLF